MFLFFYVSTLTFIDYYTSLHNVFRSVITEEKTSFSINTEFHLIYALFQLWVGIAQSIRESNYDPSALQALAETLNLLHKNY